MAKVGNWEIEFHKMMNVLADQCGQPLDGLIEMYDEELSPHGYERIALALKQIFRERRGGDRFPSVGDILEKINASASHKSIAINCVNRIFWTFYNWKLGYCGMENFESEFREKIGDLEWEVVSSMGGYRNVYKEWNEGNHGFLRSHMRETAIAILDLKSKSRIVSSENQKIGGKCE